MMMCNWSRGPGTSVRDGIMALSLGLLWLTGMNCISRDDDDVDDAQRQVHLSSGDNYISPILQGGLGGCSPPCF